MPMSSPDWHNATGAEAVRRCCTLPEGQSLQVEVAELQVGFLFVNEPRMIATLPPSILGPAVPMGPFQRSSSRSQPAFTYPQAERRFAD
jgi:hypothetical protein